MVWHCVSLTDLFAHQTLLSNAEHQWPSSSAASSSLSIIKQDSLSAKFVITWHKTSFLLEKQSTFTSLGEGFIVSI
jgi:hypothetical protein